jgi:hypothetical protein
MLYDSIFSFELGSWDLQSTMCGYHHYTLSLLKALSLFPLINYTQALLTNLWLTNL